jgi:DNA-binding MarR family transcriptional regulator
VRRGRNPSGRRAYAIELTAPGLNAQREAAGLLENCEWHYLDPLTAAERRTLLVLLGRLVARDLRES